MHNLFPLLNADTSATDRTPPRSVIPGGSPPHAPAYRAYRQPPRAEPTRRLDGLTFRVEDTKTGVPLELPITRQLGSILERRQAEAGDYPHHIRDWVFPSPTSATGHIQDPRHLYARTSESGGAKFWFHGLRNCFITVAERELMLPPPLSDQAAGQPCQA